MMHTKQTFLLCLLLFLLTAGLANHQLARGVSGVETATIQQLELTTDSLQFSLITPPGQSVQGALTVTGLADSIQTPGAPALPVYTTFIALPPDGEVAVTVRAAAVRQQYLANQPVSPVAEPQLLYHPFYTDEFELPGPGQVSRDPDDLFALSITPDETIYGVDAFYPAVYYHLSEPMMLRDVRLAQLTLYPVQYNPVRNLLVQAERLEVNVAFTGGTAPINRSSPSHQDQHIHSLQDLVINFDQIEAWRSLPLDLAGEPTRLPIGQETYKIEVDQDGIYELTYEMLAAAGMDVDNVDPRTFEMLHRGEPVAYQFVGEQDDIFQPGDAIRFYGWASLGSRIEDQYVKNNVFWLWADGTAVTIDSRDPEEGHPVADSFLDSLTHEEDHYFNFTYTNQWPSFPNEPDVWYWLRFTKPSAAPVTQTLQLTLPHPALTGPDAVFTAEFLSRNHRVVSGIPYPHVMKVHMNQQPDYGMESWFGTRNLNITGTVPITAVVNGLNQFDMVMATEVVINNPNRVELNRITVDYMRQFVAVDDHLAFSDQVGGSRTYAVTGFSQTDLSQIAVWDVSQPRLPMAVDLTATNISGSGPYTYTFGSSHSAGARFIATAAFLEPVAITEYLPVDIDPPNGAADWVAISYRDFVTGTQTLASHRADPQFGGLITHVVDFEDVVNQYGYGLAVPAAIQNYLRYALWHWATAPSYVLLVGDGNDDPAGFGCYTCASWWDNNETRFIFPNLVFEDRWQGRIPSDEPFVFLVGDDLLSDMAIGRLAVQSDAELTAVIGKIITYETNHLEPNNFDWLNKALFVSDRSDTSAGNFCHANQQIGQNYMPAALSKEYLCLEPALSPPPPVITVTHPVTLTMLMTQTVNAGISFLSYRGHGTTNAWGQSILTTSAAHQASWQNQAKPVVILSLDCLDGWFSLPGSPGLGETYHGLAHGGSAAHWSSSGLGTTFEHSILHQHFNRGLYNHGLTSIGSAIQYAKLRYYLANGHRSMIYSFVLLGDPAMQLMRPDLQLSQQLTTVGQILPGDEIELQIEITNEGLYPALASLVSQLPPRLAFVSASADVGLTVAAVGQTITLTLDYGGGFPNRGLPYGETAVINVTLQVDPTYGGGTVAVTSTAQTPGLSLTADGKQATTQVFVFSPTVELNPFVGYSVQGGVRLEWTTVAEFNTQGFWVDRSTDGPGGPFTRLTTIGLIPATGSGAAGTDYTALDNAVQKNQTYWYRLVEQKTEGFPLERLLQPVIAVTFDPPLSYLYLPAIAKP